MYKLNVFLNIIVIIALLTLSYIENNFVLSIFISILCLCFHKTRNLLIGKSIKTNLFHEITELIINLYLLMIAIRAIFDPSINFNNYEVMMFSYLVIRLQYIIFILLLLNLLLVKSSNHVVNLLKANNDYILTFLALTSSTLNLAFSSLFGSFGIFEIIINLIIIIFNFKLLESVRNSDDKTLFLSIAIGILGIFVNNSILLLLPLSIGYNKYQKNINKLLQI